MMLRRLLTALCVAVLAVCMPVKSASANTFYVTNKNDSGVGSLRWAINQANANPGSDYIAFNIPIGTCIDGVCIINPDTDLPPLTDDGTTIDGYTQPGAAPATASTPATIVIQIDGADPVLNNALNIISANNLIRGLSITRFNLNGIAIGAILGGSGSGNVIVGNYIGVRPLGSEGAGNVLDGIYLGYGATNNRIGGDEPAERNVISSNTLDGVAIHGSGTNGNTVSGNYIGTDDSGTAALPNGANGVRVYGGAQDNLIGGDDPAEGNVISGNSVDGVRIMGAGTSDNEVWSNLIGTDASGSSDLGNGMRGVQIESAAGNTIGPDNLISGNDGHGVRIIGPDASGNEIRDNYIGADTSGIVALANSSEGIYLLDASDTTITDNLISGNGNNGIWVDGSDGSLIWGNYIGVGTSGITPLGNGHNGVFIGSGSQDNYVGGDSPDQRNVISANDTYGIHVADTGTVSNTIAGNYVGLGANGSTVLGNADGIRIDSGVQDTNIGPYNVVSGNEGFGIWLTGPDTSGNIVWDSYIGTDASGSSARGNTDSGIAIWDGAQNNTIGGNAFDTGNLISGNGDDGIELYGAGTSDNDILGNYIGTDASGSYAIGNAHAGVSISGDAHDNMVGGVTTGDRNIISGNLYGVLIEGESTTGNYISGNYIGSTTDRMEALGNQLDGVHISYGAKNNAIGPGNTIAHNSDDGVRIDTPTAYGNMVLENSIFDNFNMGIDLTNGANHNIQPPTILASTEVPSSVSGSTCPNCLVEVFCSHDTDGEGEIPLGHMLADASGNFNLALDWLYYPYLTATASTLADGTSEFSAIYTAQVPDLVFLPFIR